MARGRVMRVAAASARRSQVSRLPRFGAAVVAGALSEDRRGDGLGAVEVAGGGGGPADPQRAKSPSHRRTPTLADAVPALADFAGAPAEAAHRALADRFSS